MSPGPERPERATESAEQVFTAYLQSVVAGESRPWEAFRAEHPGITSELDALYESYRRGGELMGQLDGKPGAEGLDLEIVLQELGEPRSHQCLRVLGPIARGGMALIERVWDDRLHRALARKVLPLDVRAAHTLLERRRLVRFLEEAHICSQLQHPGVLPVFDLAIDESGRPFFTMPIVQGQDFGAVIRCVHAGRDGWTLTRALQVLVSVCDTVAYAHAKGIVHRDLKPENLMIGRFGEAFVMDWGLAKVLPGAAASQAQARSVEIDSLRRTLAATEAGEGLGTLDGDVVGTPAFMAPEQAAGFVTMVEARSDQYAIGAILYQMLTARRPYEDRPELADSTALIAVVQKEPPTPVARLAPRAPQELVAICERAMQRDPVVRYASVADLALDLRAYLEDRVVRAYETGPVAMLRKWVRRNRGFAALAAATLVLTIGGLLAFVAITSAGASRLEETNVSLRAAQAELGERVRDLRRAAYHNDIAFAQRAQQAGSDGAEAKRVLAACPPDLRGWEWYYLSQLADSSVQKVAGRWAVAFSADGRLLANAIEASVVVHDLARGQIVHRIPCRAIVDAIEFSPDRRWLACWARDQTLRVCDLTTGSVREARVAGVPGACLTFSPDSKRIACRQGLTEVSVLDVADVAALATVKTLRHESTHLTALAWSGSAGLVAGDHAGKLHVWQTDEWTCTRVDASESRILSIVALATTGRLVVCDAFGAAKLLDGRDGREVKQLMPRRRAKGLDHARVDPTGRWQAVSHDTSVELTNLETGEMRRLHGHESVVAGLAFSATGKLAAWALDATTRIWNVQQPAGFRLLGRCPAGVAKLAIAPDNSAVLAGAGSYLVRLPLDGTAITQVSTDVRVVSGVCHAGDRVLVAGQTPRISQHHPVTLAHLGYVDLDVGMFQALALSADGRRLVVGSDFKGAWLNAVVLDLAAGGEARLFSIAFAPTGGVFAPDGQRFALIGSDGIVHIRDGVTAESLHEVRVADLKLETIDWSHDGRLIAASGRVLPTWEIQLIDPDRGQVVGRLEGHRSIAHDLQFAPDGRLLSTGDGTLRVWDVEARRCVLVVPLPGTTWHKFRLSRDGTVLAVATGADVWVWTR